MSPVQIDTNAAKAEILARVRGAVADLSAPLGARGDVPLIEQSSTGPAETIELFVENVIDYKAAVVRVPADQVGAAVAEALAHAASVIVPSGLEADWIAQLPNGIRVLRDSPPLGHADLDAAAAVVTAARVGIATTGTIVLDHGPDQGRRAVSLVPDLHVCVIRSEQVVHDVPEAVVRLRPAPAGVGVEHPRALTWISGPSATSDIELDRVEGVHGPRTLHVILVEG